MKFAKLKAFLTGKKIETPIAEKGDGTVMLTAEQAAAVDTLAGELETAQASLQTATENLNAANSEIATLRGNVDALNTRINEINTELGIEGDASAVDAIKALGKQPGTMGATVTKGKDENPEGGAGAEFVTSFDKEAQDIYTRFHGK